MIVVEIFNKDELVAFNNYCEDMNYPHLKRKDFDHVERNFLDLKGSLLWIKEGDKVVIRDIKHIWKYLAIGDRVVSYEKAKILVLKGVKLWD